MILHNFWKDHFLSLTTANKLDDRNIPGFTGGMNFESSAKEKMTAQKWAKQFPPHGKPQKEDFAELTC